MELLRSGVSLWSVLSMMHSVQSDVTARSIPRIVSSHMDSKPSGKESLRVVQRARAELTRRQQQQRHAVTGEQRRRLLCLHEDLQQVWHAPSTSLRDKKELLRTLLEEISVSVYREQFRALLKLRWRGGMLSEIDVSLPRSRPATVRTDEDTIAFARRLAQYHDDATIAGILKSRRSAPPRGHTPMLHRSARIVQAASAREFDDQRVLRTLRNEDWSR